MNSINNEPMFRSAGQALSVAFSVMASQAPITGSTARALDSMSEQRYGAAAVVDSDRSINRVGLKPNEFHAQCGLIVATVEKRLPDHERDVIYARFGHQLVRAAGVRGLLRHYRSLCTTQNEGAVHALIMGIYARGVVQHPGESPRAFNARRKKRQLEWSVRSIEKEYGVAKSTVHRDQIVLKKLFYGIENQAQSRLEMLFLAAGLIGDPNA